MDNSCGSELFGALLVVDADDQLVGKCGDNNELNDPSWPNMLADGKLRAPKLVAGEVRSPHGIAVDAEGRVVITEWLIGGRATISKPAPADDSASQ